MKKTEFTLQIENPCHEKKENMNKIDIGHYCHSCKKNVIDFREKSSVEIADFFMLNKDEDTCGTFYQHQLEQNYTHIEYEQKSNLKYAAGFLVAMLLAQNNSAQVLGMVKTRPTSTKNKLKIGLVVNSDTLTTSKNIAADSLKESSKFIRHDSIIIIPYPVFIKGGYKPIISGKVAPCIKPK